MEDQVDGGNSEEKRGIPKPSGWSLVGGRRKDRTHVCTRKGKESCLDGRGEKNSIRRMKA